MTTEQPPPSLASVTLDWAIAASQAATTGSVTEADLEHVHARLVFNVGVGNNDVKVDASTGAVITAGLDD